MVLASCLRLFSESPADGVWGAESGTAHTHAAATEREMRHAAAYRSTSPPPPAAGPGKQQAPPPLPHSRTLAQDNRLSCDPNPPAAGWRLFRPFPSVSQTKTTSSDPENNLLCPLPPPSPLCSLKVPSLSPLRALGALLIIDHL